MPKSTSRPVGCFFCDEAASAAPNTSSSSPKRTKICTSSAAFWTAALLVQIFVRFGEDDEVLGAAEAASSQKKQPTGRDVLFGIPVKYWSVLLLALGVGYYYLG